MLRLLAQREQGYEDMAALMGVSVEELRGRVREALSELEREGKEAPELPPPPAAPQPDKPSPAAAEPPELSATPAAEQVPPPKPPKRAASSLLSSTGARIGVAAVAAAVAAVVVLLLVLGGGDSGSSTSASTTTAGGGEATGATLVQKAIATTEAGKGKEVTKAVLQPDTGGEGQGVAIFGRVKNALALQIVAEGLAPLGAEQSYAIWIAQSPRRMLPLAASPVRKNGTIASQFEVPTELLAYLANETFDEIAITRASNTKLNAALETATKAKRTPAYTGTPVMRGPITGPIVGAAKRIEAEQGKGKAKE
ncbi:MAG: hypothetical protein AB7V58_11650 [Solirubrobacterales bacterium]